MRVLVTGATGFLGSHLARKLIESGQTVRILARKSSGTSILEGLGIECAFGDINEVGSLTAATRDVAAVFHAAGLVSYSRTARPAMERVNVEGTANIVRSCHENRIERLVHVSSVVTVGASFDGCTVLNEDSEYTLGHLNLGYFETKRAAERLVLDAARHRRIDAVVVNPSTIYGAGDARKGSRRTQVKVAQGRYRSYPHGGVNVIAVEDVVDAIVRAWEVGRTGERYIISGENLFIRDLFRLIAAEAGVRPPSVCIPTPVVKLLGRIGGLLEQLGKPDMGNTESAIAATLFHWFDSAKARRELGLRPKPAQHAIAESVSWMRQAGLLEPGKTDS